MKRTLAGAALAAAVATGVGVGAASMPVHATPSTATSQVLIQAPVNPLRIRAFNRTATGKRWSAMLRTRGMTDGYIVENDFQPGQTTGWHSHPGPSLIFVVSGAVTNYESDQPHCAGVTYSAGSTFVDAGGKDVHELVDNGTNPAETLAVQFIPSGQPRRIDEPEPSNCHNVGSSVVGSALAAGGMTVPDAGASAHAVHLRWRTRAGMPTARAALASAVSKGRIYTLGGFTTGEAKALRAAQVYNPKTNHWRAIAAMPTASAMLGAASVGRRVFAIGGLNTNGDPLSAVQVYNTRTRHWQQKAPLPVAAGQITATAHDGLIYAVGGVDKADHSLARLQIYHPRTNRWTHGAPMPTPRGLAQSTWSGGRLYVIGGVAGADETRLGAVESYNPKTNTWRKRAPLPIPRAHPAVGTIEGNRIIVAGGGVASHENITSVEIYTPATNSWQRGSGLKRADSGGPTGAVIAGNRFYVIGGFFGTNVRAIKSVQTTTVS